MQGVVRHERVVRSADEDGVVRRDRAVVGEAAVPAEERGGDGRRLVGVERGEHGAEEEHADGDGTRAADAPRGEGEAEREADGEDVEERDYYGNVH